MFHTVYVRGNDILELLNEYFNRDTEKNSISAAVLHAVPKVASKCLHKPLDPGIGLDHFTLSESL